jgi:hypothetical protein
MRIAQNLMLDDNDNTTKSAGMEIAEIAAAAAAAAMIISYSLAAYYYYGAGSSRYLKLSNIKHFIKLHSLPLILKHRAFK